MEKIFKGLKMSKQLQILKEENIIHQIYFIRGEKVMLDFELSLLYNVETKALKRAVRRNIDLFPEDFMFEIPRKEFHLLRSQIGTLEDDDVGKGKHPKYLPFAFTEQGVAMRSGVLKSKRAREVNIAIMRTFVRMRKLIDAHKELSIELKKLESRVDKNDEAIEAIFEASLPIRHEKRLGIKDTMKRNEMHCFSFHERIPVRNEFRTPAPLSSPALQRT